jgi:hypothetical protein
LPRGWLVTAAQSLTRPGDEFTSCDELIFHKSTFNDDKNESALRDFSRGWRIHWLLVLLELAHH